MPIRSESNLSASSEQEMVHLVQLKLQVMKLLEVDSESRAAPGQLEAHTQIHAYARTDTSIHTSSDDISIVYFLLLKTFLKFLFVKLHL